MELSTEIYSYGTLNIMKYEENFPWEKIIVDAMRYGLSVYLIFGNYVNMNLRLVHTTLKRLKMNENITIRRGFTYYQLLEIVLEINSYYDIIIFFHDPISFRDLSSDEKFTLSQAVMLNLFKYAEMFDSITVFAHTESFNFKYTVKRIEVNPVRKGWKITSNGKELFIYYDPLQVPLDYFMEV